MSLCRLFTLVYFFREKERIVFIFHSEKSLWDLSVILKNNAQVFLGIHKNWTWFEVGNLLDLGL